MRPLCPRTLCATVAASSCDVSSSCRAAKNVTVAIIARQSSSQSYSRRTSCVAHSATQRCTTVSAVRNASASSRLLRLYFRKIATLSRIGTSRRRGRLSPACGADGSGFALSRHRRTRSTWMPRSRTPRSADARSRSTSSHNRRARTASCEPSDGPRSAKSTRSAVCAYTVARSLAEACVSR